MWLYISHIVEQKAVNRKAVEKKRKSGVRVYSLLRLFGLFAERKFSPLTPDL